jgi:ribosomal protein L7/L12
MTSNDVYERLGVLEHLVQHLLASGDKIGAIKAYRDATNVDLATARRIIESL